MEQEPRPFISYRWWHLEAYAEQNWDYPTQLQLLLDELIRRIGKHSSSLRERVIARLVELSLAEVFPWPKTEVASSSTALKKTDDWHEEGLLRFLGYRVGQQGISRADRRDILDYIYNKQLPRVHSEEYMAEWGKEKTAKRLRKLAESLAAFARNAKRRSLPPLKAIRDWEADLEYLRVTYYVGRYDFPWPASE